MLLVVYAMVVSQAAPNTFVVGCYGWLLDDGRF